MNTFSNMNSIILSSVMYYNNNYLDSNLNTNLDILSTDLKDQNVFDYSHQENIVNDFLNINKKNNITNLVNTIENIVDEIKEKNFLNISLLIGHNVLIANSNIIHIQDHDIIYGYSLPSKTLFTLISIKDKNNKIVFSHKIHSQKSGEYIYYWNGKLDNKNIIDTGSYNLSIIAINQTNSIVIQPLVYDVVTGIEKTPNSDTYIIDLKIMGKVYIEDIKRIF